MKELFLVARVGVVVAGLSALVSCGPSPGTEGTSATGTGGAGGTADTTDTTGPTGTTGTGASGGVSTSTPEGGSSSTSTPGQGGFGGMGGGFVVDLPSLCSAGVGGSGSGASGGAGGSDCSLYPTDGQGNTIGSVLPPHFEFSGYLPQSDVVSTISLADYHDCDGSKGIHALYVIESATWCRPCQEDAHQIGELMKGAWKDLGIKVVTLMVMNAQFEPATYSTALAWRDAFELGTTAVGIDPDSTLYKHFCSPDTLVFPFGLLIDPRTMTIVSAHLSGGLDLVEALALQNQTP